MKKLARRTALALLTATILIGAGWQWFTFNWWIMSKAGRAVEQWENSTERD